MYIAGMMLHSKAARRARHQRRRLPDVSYFTRIWVPSMRYLWLPEKCALILNHPGVFSFLFRRKGFGPGLPRARLVAHQSEREACHAANVLLTSSQFISPLIRSTGAGRPLNNPVSRTTAQPARVLFPLFPDRQEKGAFIWQRSIMWTASPRLWLRGADSGTVNALSLCTFTDTDTSRRREWNETQEPDEARPSIVCAADGD